MSLIAWFVSVMKIYAFKSFSTTYLKINVICLYMIKHSLCLNVKTFNYGAEEPHLCVLSCVLRPVPYLKNVL